ncbi:MAG: hypothetical protein AAFO94_11735, partial [Bacteroidota bacterium]
FKSLSQYDWGGDVLFYGKFVKATEVPWHYTLSWIMISTPMLYLLLFAFSYIRLTLRLPLAVLWWKQLPVELEQEHRRLIFWCLFTAPMLAVVVFQSTLYDAWRQMFFVYPAMLIIAGETLVYLTKVADRTGPTLRRWLPLTVYGIVLVQLVGIAIFMIRNHPHQNVYFNRLAVANAQTQFELDYWGMSNKQVLEQLLAHDTRDTIRIRAANWAVSANKDILTPAQRKRLKYVGYEEADYYISNHREWRDYYRLRDHQAPFDQPVIEIKVQGNTICGAYRAVGPLPKYPE